MSVAAHPQPVQPDTTVRKVLVFRLGSLGDTLVALPSLHLIAQAFPHAERRMLTNVPVLSRAPAAAAVLGESGIVHSYETYPVGTRNPLALLRLLLKLRRFRPDVAVYLKAETTDALARRDRRFLQLTGARRIVGVSAQGSEPPQQLADGTWEPESQRLLRSVRELGAFDLQDRCAWELRLQPAEIAKAEGVLGPLRAQPFFAVSVGTKVQSKHWGERNWTELLRAVAQRYAGHGLLLAGAPEEKADSERASLGWSTLPEAGPVVNACGLLTPRESAAAFREARCFLGHDSGPMHLAAAAGVPTVAVFAARNKPRTWFPFGAPSRVLYHAVDCRGCGLETCLEQRKKCILSITVQEAMLALEDLLKTEERTTDVA